jgi:hypothetical protein
MAAVLVGAFSWHLGAPGELEQTIKEIHDEALSSPKVALLRLSIAMENKSRDILAQTNWGQGKSNISLDQAFEQLHTLGQLPPSASASFNQFSDITRRIISGAYLVSDSDIMSALDSGIGLLKQLYAIPIEENIVSNPDVAIYSDAECKVKLTDVRAVILETTSPGGSSKSFRIYPTTRTDYRIGELVSWEWNMSRIWGQAWYRDPADGKIKQAWTQSAEFIGRRLFHLPESSSAIER